MGSLLLNRPDKLFLFVESRMLNTRKITRVKKFPNEIKKDADFYPLETGTDRIDTITK